MNRSDGLARLANETFDVLVIGGGATGLGTALDAAARGYRTALVEARDFAGATSSRSTKLVHGGVRYLPQGNVALVREALLERARLIRNAPHLVHAVRFAVPAYSFAELAYYAAGLKLYDVLARDSAFSRSHIVRASEMRELVPALGDRGLRGAVLYEDGQFDDTRLAVSLAQTAVDRGAALANYCPAIAISKSGSRATGIVAQDAESGERFAIAARAVVNAAGIFADEVRAIDRPGAAPMLAFSRGSHVVLPAAALGGGTALLIPKTSDGRVLFAVPWHERVVAGTTDVAVREPSFDPQPSSEEIAFILETLNRYLKRPAGEGDILASFAGLRPLLQRAGVRTAKLAREHAVETSSSGVVTIAGGKWTTYRSMAQSAVDAAVRAAGLPFAPCTTASLALHDPAPALRALIASDPSLAQPLHPRLAYTRADVVHAARSEMARTAGDVLSRRTRAAVLDAAAARECAPYVETVLRARS